MVNVQDIYAARRRIAPLVQRTPLEYSRPLSEATGAEVYLKLEMMRETRAFKVRGATNFIVALSPEERQQGVVAAAGSWRVSGVPSRRSGRRQR